MIYRRGILDQAHARNARMHALKRLRQRFGIELDMDGLAAIEAKLVAARYRWIAVRRDRQTITYEVPIGAVTTYALFNIRLWAIVSFVEKARGQIRPAIAAESA